MAGVETLTTGQKLSVRVWKNWNGVVRTKWSNTYEVLVTEDVGDPNALLFTLANNCMQFERAISLTPVTFMYGVVSTWAPDSDPYEGDEFTRVPFYNLKGLAGGLPGALGALPLEDCLWVSRNTATGYSGRIALRGVLTKDLVSTGVNGWVVDFSGLEEGFDEAVTKIDPYLDKNNSPLLISMFNKTGPPRYVKSVSMYGHVHVSMDKQWYNRNRT